MAGRGRAVRLAWALSALACLLAAAADPGGARRPRPHHKPTVRSLGPATGTTVSGPVRWRVRARGFRPLRVDFLIDGVRRWSDRRAPYRFGRRGSWNSRSVADGRHELIVRAHRRGRRALRRTTTVLVHNGVAGSPPAAAPAPAAATAGYVVRAGRRLYLDGHPFRFTGINIYNANSDGSCAYAMNEGSILGDALEALTAGPEHRVIRAWFFQGMATRDGRRDWSAFDHTLAVARAHGARVIAVLADQWGYCDPAGYKDAGWYENGYRRPDPGGTVSYRTWAAEVARRYRDESAVLAWQLLNEAQVTDAARACGPGAASILRTWAADAAGVVRAADPLHLVSLGTIGVGNCGAEGDSYQEVHDVPAIDLCEYHDYRREEMPGDAFNGLARRIEQCAALDKPLFVGESGITVGDGGGLQPRAEAFARKFTAQFRAGVAGELIWSWNAAGSNGSYDVGPGDPALDVLGRY